MCSPAPLACEECATRAYGQRTFDVVDVRIGNVIHRFIAVYLPHVGYSHQHVCMVYEQVYSVLSKSQRLGYAVAVAGISICSGMWAIVAIHALNSNVQVDLAKCSWWR